MNKNQSKVKQLEDHFLRVAGEYTNLKILRNEFLPFFNEAVSDLLIVGRLINELYRVPDEQFKSRLDAAIEKGQIALLSAKAFEQGDRSSTLYSYNIGKLIDALINVRTEI
jgi:hypothetical protein